MKRKFIVLLLVLTLPTASYAVPVSELSNPHNMANDPANPGPKAASTALGGTDQVCIFCHTPHSATPESPLWSRPAPIGPNGDGTFPIYTLALGIKNDPVLTGYNSAMNYPSGASRMCLSCHDGVTSLGFLVGRAPIVMDGSDVLVNDGILGNIQGVIDLTTSHPISFNYNQEVITQLLNADEFRLPDGTVDTPLDGPRPYDGTTSAQRGQMQCTTCHDPHEDTKALASYGNLPFWRHQGDATSYVDVCNACHWNNTVDPGVPAPPTGTPH